MSVEKLLLTPKEVFQIIGVSRSKGYSLLQAKVIPSIRIGKSVRIPTQSLRQWVEHEIAEQK
jgi:excisionase family DNA binding protein